jgi:hypothetical protein
MHPAQSSYPLSSEQEMAPVLVDLSFVEGELRKPTPWGSSEWVCRESTSPGPAVDLGTVYGFPMPSIPMIPRRSFLGLCPFSCFPVCEPPLAKLLVSSLAKQSSCYLASKFGCSSWMLVQVYGF